MNDTPGKMLSYRCQSDTDHHCLTCADEAVTVKVVGIDQEAGLALCHLWSGGVGMELAPILETSSIPLDQVEEIDITLVEGVAVGDILLAHAGVAIAHQGKEQTREH